MVGGESLQNRVRDYLIELQPAVVVEVNGIEFLSIVEREAQLIAQVNERPSSVSASHLVTSGEQSDFIATRFPNSVKLPSPTKVSGVENNRLRESHTDTDKLSSGKVSLN